MRQTSGYVWLHEHYHTCSKMYVIASFQKCPRHGLDRVRPLLEFSSAACDPHLAKYVRRTPTWACSASSCSLCKEQLASHHLSHQSSQSAWTVTSVCSPKPLTICLQFSWSTASLLSSNPVVRPTDIHSSHSSNWLLKVVHSFLPFTIVDWNLLPFSVWAKPSVESFHAGLQHLTVSTSSHWAEPQHSSSNESHP